MMADWWDNISKSIGGMFTPTPEEDKKPKGLDMAMWGPVLEKAGYGPDSPEYMLLDTIGKHAAATPMPKDPGLGQQLLGGALLAGGAGLARFGGGASYAEATRPAMAAMEYLRDRKGQREALLAGIHEKLGGVAAGQASSAISTAQARRMAAEMATRQRARLFGTPEAEEPAAPPAGSPPTSSPIYKGPTAALPPPESIPGVTVAPPAAGTPPPGGPPPPDKTAAGGPPGGKSGKFDEPQYPLAPNSPIRFFTKQYRDAAVPIIDAAIAENAAAIASGAKNKEDVLKSEAQKPGSALKELLDADRTAWLQSDQYKAHEHYRTKNMDRSFESVKEIDAAASAARKGNSDLAQFENALLSHIKEGGTTGPLQDWAATIKSWANGIPGVDFDVSRIEEMRKASIGAATKFMRSATVGPTSDREMKTFIDSVTNAGMSTQGNLRLLPFLKLQNDAALETRQLAGQLMEANNGVLPWDFSERAEAIQQKYQAQAKKLGDQLVADYKAGKLGPPKADGKPGAPDAAAAPAAAMSADEAKAAARELIAKNPGMSASDAMKQVLSQGKSAAPGAAVAPGAPDAAAKPAPGGEAPKASGKKPSQAAPYGTRKDGWIMSPTGWVPEAETTRVHTWAWERMPGGTAWSKQQSQPAAPRKPINPSGASWWSRNAEDNIRRSTGVGG
jgi:hypothetical protein